MRRHSLTLVAALGGAAGVAYAAASHKAPPAAHTTFSINTQTTTTQTPEPPRDNVQDTVQIALLLDTSSSMDGLINQARAHLWNMVDQMGRMTRVVNGKTRTVKIELALYEYGNDTIPEKAGYIRQVQSFTGDLDKVSEKLHALFTNGGSEFAGQAIETAVTQLQWSKDPAAMKFVFVAGNESFDQGPVSAVKAMAAAAKQDINVQLIFCGTKDESWEAAAKIASTDLMTIDQNQVAQHIPSPQDDEILRLGAQLNNTYIAYGADGQAAAARQLNADASSAKMSPKVALERAQLKGKRAYKNDSWDMVDALEDKPRFFEETKEADLPAEFQGKTLEEKKAIVAKKASERAELKAKIAKLEIERNKFLDAERKKLNADEGKSLETELMKSTKKIANKKGYDL